MLPGMQIPPTQAASSPKSKESKKPSKQKSQKGDHKAMFCPECGGELDEKSSFCVKCGKKVEK